MQISVNFITNTSFTMNYSEHAKQTNNKTNKQKCIWRPTYGILNLHGHFTYQNTVYVAAGVPGLEENVPNLFSNIGF